LADAACLGYAGSLKERGFRRDVGIEAEPEVVTMSMAPACRILGCELVDVALNARYESLVGLRKIRSARCVAS